ncbi:MAG: F0F1 ATP synthase subunit epsilon, partial [Clostridia bacterium]|nr:F0F1 ATP synthase subunit epsilon [Clostridia bacterium]
MNTFHLTVASPDGNKFSGDVIKLDVRGTEGELAVMAGHIPFVTSLVECDCLLYSGTQYPSLYGF